VVGKDGPVGLVEGGAEQIRLGTERGEDFDGALGVLEGEGGGDVGGDDAGLDAEGALDGGAGVEPLEDEEAGEDEEERDHRGADHDEGQLALDGDVPDGPWHGGRVRVWFSRAGPWAGPGDGN
jgi:hypothetical protein